MHTEEISALWAPWRAVYFKRGGTPDFLLEAARATDDAAHLVVARRPHAIMIMNLFPYAVGHMMIAPCRKVGTLAELSDAEKLDLLNLTDHAQVLLRATVGAQGFNIGLNIGRCAGASVVDHLHLHVVPRWEGDNNFMPVLAGERVLPEALDSLYQRLIATQASLPH